MDLLIRWSFHCLFIVLLVECVSSVIYKLLLLLILIELFNFNIFRQFFLFSLSSSYILCPLAVPITLTVELDFTAQAVSSVTIQPSTLFHIDPMFSKRISDLKNSNDRLLNKQSVLCADTCFSSALKHSLKLRWRFETHLTSVTNILTVILFVES